MGSTYRPRDRDRGRGGARYDDRPPPPPPRRHDNYDRRDGDHGRDSYRPSGDNNQNRSQQRHDFKGLAPHDSRGQAPQSYVFRGAASGDRYSDHRVENNFTFQSNAGPPAPRFPAAHEQPLPPRPNRGPRDPPRNAGRNRDRDRPPGGRHGGPEKGRRFGPRPAHARDLLTRTTRETTPEQLAGMNDVPAKFREVEDDSSDESDDDSSEEDENDENEGTRKRVKTAAITELSQPRWSNPDPYTALPPPSQANGPKKDIVESIRKAKIEQSALVSSSANPVKDNIDFISFDDDNDDDDDDDDVADTDLVAHVELDRPGRGRKRGHEEITPDVALGGAISSEWLAHGVHPTPWWSTPPAFTSNVGLQLHKEIADFYEFVKPLDFENIVRQEIATRIQNVIQGWYLGRGVQVYSFGSYPAGLYLPNADMDLVALSPRYLQSAEPAFCLTPLEKRKLRSVLRSASIFDPTKDAVVVAHARVPLIKFTDMQTGLKVDISFENHSGLQAQGTLKVWKEQFPDMPVLVALIKQFLAMRNLNEVFRGGIGGFTIICLVVSMLQHMPEYQSNNLDPMTRYGDLLMNFFDLYGNKFNYVTTGIIMEPPAYFDKQKEWERMNIRYQDDRLTIIDPNRSDNDISGGSRLIDEVFNCFKGAHALIQRRLDQLRKGEASSGSILECILGGDYSAYATTRARLQRVYLRDHPEAAQWTAPAPPQTFSNPIPLPAKPPKRAGSQDRSKKKKAKKAKAKSAGPKPKGPRGDVGDVPKKKKKPKKPKKQKNSAKKNKGGQQS